MTKAYPKRAKRRDKVAVSISQELLSAIEAIRKQSGDSRSAVFERALSAYVASGNEAATVRRYAEGYRKHPETLAEQRAALARSLEALAANVWDA